MYIIEPTKVETMPHLRKQTLAEAFEILEAHWSVAKQLMGKSVLETNLTHSRLGALLDVYPYQAEGSEIYPPRHNCRY